MYVWNLRQAFYNAIHSLFVLMFCAYRHVSLFLLITFNSYVLLPGFKLRDPLVIQNIPPTEIRTGRIVATNCFAKIFKLHIDEHGSLDFSLFKYNVVPCTSSFQLIIALLTIPMFRYLFQFWSKQGSAIYFIAITLSLWGKNCVVLNCPRAVTTYPGCGATWSIWLANFKRIKFS